jgi:hypothetical protein
MIANPEYSVCAGLSHHFNLYLLSFALGKLGKYCLCNSFHPAFLVRFRLMADIRCRIGELIVNIHFCHYNQKYGLCPIRYDGSDRGSSMRNFLSKSLVSFLILSFATSLDSDLSDKLT